MGTVKNQPLPASRNFVVLCLFVLSAALFAAASVGAIWAEKSADFSTATLTAEAAVLLGPQPARYTLVLTNTGQAGEAITVTATLPEATVHGETPILIDAPASGVVELERVVMTDSLIWRGVIEPDAVVTMAFSANILPATPAVTLTHQVAIDYSGEELVLTAPLRYAGEPVTQLYMPILSVPREPITLTASEPVRQGDFYAWTVTWDAEDYSNITRFALEESHDPNFETGVNRYVMRSRTRHIVHAASPNNVYYYRIVPHGGGTASNTAKVVSAFYDDFSAETSTWQIRREDFDDTNNELTRTKNNHLNLWVHGRWDYMIASPLAPAPAPPYRIETRVKFAGPASRNTYGIIFGANWNGQSCKATKNVDAPENTNCLSQYYRAMMLWHTDKPRMKTNLKRIDRHNSKNGGIGGNILQDWNDASIGASASDWNTWVIEVHVDGTIKVMNDGRTIAEGVDPQFITNPYWGLWASTDADLGSDPLFDYILVEPLSTSEE